ncbi:septal ring lytic transglycosylase RlpA family protein [Marinimicrobium alkaliphilum]|uniref:septal ring lytic transglycosylase RlpA family protein n=1 Tax=Marinimicrobium alkaliphilum TaxID=2202654 RepID=UPI000DBA9004|nr:septal ring lytic transglycosylase RlpA family protein [Marinimicrobium alkaliphilum]
MTTLKLFLPACALALLAACAGFPPLAPEPPEERDRGPSEPVDLSDVPDAVPRHEVRTLAGNRNPYTVLGRTYRLIDDETDYQERGIASWYGKKFHGRHTSNGEIYDMYAMTAAHKKLPIPSYVRVTNVDNGRSVVVRVNDRGPFHDNRIIDLSYAAAQRLGFADQGTAMVDVEIIVPDGTAPAPLRQAGGDTALPSNAFLQVGAFREQSSAQRLAESLAPDVEHGVIVSHATTPAQVYRVRVGPLVDTGDLHRAREQLQALGYDQTPLVYETP